MTTLLFLLTIRSHGKGVGSLDGVAGITRRQLLLPKITATLGRWWSPPLQLRVAPSLFPRPLSRTSSGCSSACRGPWHSGMRLLGLYCRLLVSSVLGCCLAPTAPMTSAAPVACSSASVPAPDVATPAGAASVTASLVDVSLLGSLPAQRSTTVARLVGRGPFGWEAWQGSVPFPCSLCPFGECVWLLF